MQISTYACFSNIHTGKRMYTYDYKHIYRYSSMYTYIFIHNCTYIYMFKCAYKRKYMYILIYEYISIYIYMYTCTFNTYICMISISSFEIFMYVSTCLGALRSNSLDIYYRYVRYSLYKCTCMLL